MGCLSRQFLHLAMQVYTADTHLLGYHVDAQVGVVQVLVDGLHHALQQFLVGRLHLYVLHLFLQAFRLAELLPEQLAGIHQVDDGAAQYIHVERLDDIGVSPRLETLQLVFVAVLGSQQDDGYVVGLRIRLQLRAEGVAVHLGHHDVADDDVGQGAVDLSQCIAAVDTGLDLIVAGEFLLQVVAYLVVILGDDYLRLSVPVVEQCLHRFQLLRFFDLYDLSRAGFLFGEHLFWFEVGIAQGDADGEFAALFQVVGLDVAVVHLHE